MLKLFVWNEVYCDYTCGVAFALAETKEQAEQLLLDAAKQDQQAIIDAEQAYIDSGGGKWPRLEGAQDRVAHAAEYIAAEQKRMRWELEEAEKAGRFKVYEQVHAQYVWGGG